MKPLGSKTNQRFHGKRQLRHLWHHRINIRHLTLRGQALGLDQLKYPLNTKGPPHCRSGLTAQLLNQIIVTPAPADGALGAQLVRDKLKHGEVVIVHASYQTGIQAISHRVGAQDCLNGLKVGHGICAQEINQAWGRIHELLHLRILGVQNPQGIGVQTPQRVLIKLTLMKLKISHQCLPVL